VSKKTLLTAAFISVLLLPTVAGTLLVNLGRANPSPYPPDTYSEEGSPRNETEPPTVSIIAPTNGTSYSSSSLSLTYNVSIGNSITASVRFLWNVTFEADWLAQRVTAYDFNADKDEDPYTSTPTLTELSETLNLTGIPEGTHSLMVHAQERGAYERYDCSGFPTKLYITNFFIEGSSLVFFTVDLTAPTVSVLSIQNTTYDMKAIDLNFSVSEPISQIAYSLDKQEKVAIAGNTTLAGLSVGVHNVTVYAWDAAGNVGASETITFTIAESFPAALVATVSVASIAVVGVALLVYFKKRKQQNS
jgi:hypothetical protein